MTADEYFPPIEPVEPVDPEPVPAPDVVEPEPEVTVESVPEPEVEVPAVVAPRMTAAQAEADSHNPKTPSPFKWTPGVCGHCGNADSTEPQSHHLFCYNCGRWSEMDGRPIEGNPHARANVSETFPWANAL